MEFVVLGLLLLKPMTIYELNSAFKKNISLFYSASFGSLQTAIKKLQLKGYIGHSESTEKGRNKKIYHQTAVGSAAFFQWLREEIPTSKLEVTVLSKMYFLGLIDDTQERMRIIDNMIYSVRLVLDELIKLRNQINAKTVPQNDIMRYQMKTLDYGIMSHEAALGWLEKQKA